MSQSDDYTTHEFHERRIWDSEGYRWRLSIIGWFLSFLVCLRSNKRSREQRVKLALITRPQIRR